MATPDTIVVHVPKRLGGVRSVAENLANGIEENGRPVVRASGVRELLSARRAGATSAILSLETGYFSFPFQRSVYILHGYPVVGWYSPAKRAAVRWAARMARAGGSRIVAVSHLTRAINEHIYGIPVDAVIFNGCDESLHSRFSMASARAAKRKVLAFVGRLVEWKGVRCLVEAFLSSRLPSAGYVLKIAGEGPLSEWLREISGRRPEVQLLGPVFGAAKEELFLEAEAFVSLNDFEPMGIVFVEAVLAGCKLIAPFCGGHREFIPVDHPIALCDPAEPSSVARALDRVPSLPSPPPVRETTMFSYPRSIAQRYLQLLDGAVAADAPSSPELPTAGLER